MLTKRDALDRINAARVGSLAGEPHPSAEYLAELRRLAHVWLDEIEAELVRAGRREHAKSNEKLDDQDGHRRATGIGLDPHDMSIRPYSAQRSVLQDWTNYLSFMMQSVLITACRGPDGIRKDHPVKVLIRYLRRSFLICAFDGKVRWSPYEPGGGSFTGPLHLNHAESGKHGEHIDAPVGHLDGFVGTYLRHVDELPHHFQLHLMHAAEILGYKHPDSDVRGFWRAFYHAVVSDAHLHAESESEMDKRLGDQEADWRAAELGTGLGAIAE